MIAAERSQICISASNRVLINLCKTITYATPCVARRCLFLYWDDKARYVSSDPPVPPLCCSAVNHFSVPWPRLAQSHSLIRVRSLAWTFAPAHWPMPGLPLHYRRRSRGVTRPDRTGPELFSSCSTFVTQSKLTLWVDNLFGSLTSRHHLRERNWY
ncbi:hypothetical protein VTK26DRAFT_9370 [Humicola hyalothermophila]